MPHPDHKKNRASWNQVDKDWYSDKDRYWYPSGGPTPYPLLMSIRRGNN